ASGVVPGGVVVPGGRIPGIIGRWRHRRNGPAGLIIVVGLFTGGYDGFAVYGDRLLVCVDTGGLIRHIAIRIDLVGPAVLLIHGAVYFVVDETTDAPA
ncbi:MAG: hypothetical protein WCC38_08535, partial [Pseudonocardiaceae bacterium]